MIFFEKEEKELFSLKKKIYNNKEKKQKEILKKWNTIKIGKIPKKNKEKHKMQNSNQ